MTNGTKLITGNHLETASVNAKRYILAELLTLTNAITAELNLKADDEVFSAGASGIVPAPTANDTDKFLRGDGQWATPTVSGGGSSIVVAGGTILDTESSTVDGGLWFEVVDGLPVVKMNYGGGDFLIDTRFDGDNVLIGDVLYLGGHIFKLTGFADGLTFSDNNFYVGGNSTPIGSVSSFAFQFTDAGALSVAGGGTISITQLDTNAVDYSLDLESLNTSTSTPPWDFSKGTVTNLATNSQYHYTSGTSADYLRTGAASYTSASGSSLTGQTLVLTLATGLFPTGCNDKKRNSQPNWSAESFAQYVKVDEIYDGNELKKFIVTIMSDDAITNGGTPISEIKATAPTGVAVEFAFDSNMYYGYTSHKNGSLTANSDGTYTFTTDYYKDGYNEGTTTTANATDNTKNDTTISRATGLPNPVFQGDTCRITGLASNLVANRTDNYTYDLYLNANLYTNEDTLPEGKQVGDYKSGGTKVATINKGIITIENETAFAKVANMSGGVVATVNDTQGALNNIRDGSLGYVITISDALKIKTGTEDSHFEGFAYTNGTYIYRNGVTAAHFVENDPQVDGNYILSNSISYVPKKTTATLGDTTDNKFSMTISGLPDLGELAIVGTNIYKASDVEIAKINGVETPQAKADATAVGKFNTYFKYIDFGTGGGFSDGSYYTLAAAGYPTIILSGNNDFTINASTRGKIDVLTVTGDTTIVFLVDTCYIGYTVTVSGDVKTATYHSEGISYREIVLTPPSGYRSYSQDNNATAVYWRPEGNTDDSGDILFAEFDGQDWVFNSHAFDGVTTANTIIIANFVRSTPINFNLDLATDADTLAISRTFANETFTAGATAGTYTYTATGTTAGWNVSADGSKIASWEFNGKTFTIENLRTDLGTIGFDSQGYIHATNGSTIGRMGGNVIKLYDTAVHKLATPILTGADAADFTLILPS